MKNLRWFGGYERPDTQPKLQCPECGRLPICGILQHAVGCSKPAPPQKPEEPKQIGDWPW